MSRIRNVKPEFFRHEGLQDLERANPGKYPMFVYEGLWTKCDRQGVFEWKPRSIKLDILPFLDFDMQETLGILECAGYVKKYTVDNKEYGIILTFLKHQKISLAEQKNLNVFPLPPPEQPKVIREREHTEPGQTILEPIKNGFETVLEPDKIISEPFQNPGNRKSEYGNSEIGNSDSAFALHVHDFSDPQKLFLHIWQTTPGNIFNALARIESPKEWDHFWATAPPTCEEVRRVLQNVIDDVESGDLERRYIPKTPDRFVLGGGFTRHQKRFKPTKRTSPPPNLAEKKSLGGLEA
jgi:hypothetical protein